MEARKPSRRLAGVPRDVATAPAAAPNLPAWKAFVVQFTVDSGSASGAIFAGRVEHLASGRRVRFATTRELVESLRRLLAQTAE